MSFPLHNLFFYFQRKRSVWSVCVLSADHTDIKYAEFWSTGWTGDFAGQPSLRSLLVLAAGEPSTQTWQAPHGSAETLLTVQLIIGSYNTQQSQNQRLCYRNTHFCTHTLSYHLLGRVWPAWCLLEPAYSQYRAPPPVCGETTFFWFTWHSNSSQIDMNSCFMGFAEQQLQMHRSNSLPVHWAVYRADSGPPEL